MQSKEMKMTISGAALNENFNSSARKKAFWTGLTIIALVALVAVVWVIWGLKGREQEFEVNLEKRLELLAVSQVQLIEAQFEMTIDQANRVINSDLFRLYAAEIHLIEGDVSLLVSGPLPGQPGLDEGLAQLAAQMPMMQNLLLEFTRISGYLGGRVINQNGTVYIATDAATTPLRSDQVALVEQVLQGQKPLFGPLRNTEQGLVLEAFLPIFPLEASGLEQAPVAVLLLTRVAGARLGQPGIGSPLEKGERVRLLQRVTDGFEEIVPWLPGQLQRINQPAEINGSKQLLFGIRSAIAGQTKTYSLGVALASPDWWVIVEADYDTARQALRGQQKTLFSIAILLVLFFAVAFGALWGAYVSYRDRKVAKYFEHLAEKIDKQRQLLDRINNTISDYIVLKDLQGRYLYVNPAFAQAVGRTPEELVGLDNEAVFGYDTARRLEHSDQQVLTSGEPMTFSETLYLQSQPHHLQISKAAIKTAEGQPSGLVSVIRDVTEMVESRKRQEQATAKTVEALIRAIELTDPYLGGQSRLMGAFGTEVAKAMNAGDLDLATIETAANLSQIGKLFIRRELLFKSEPLTAEEKKEMEKHVAHAAGVLQDIDFGLPVFEAVSQMNEGLDGKGYPAGLQGEAIKLPARVLAVVNSFCAMVAPRAYRGARSVGEALEIIEKTGASTYDPRVVAALKDVVFSAIGEKLLARIARE